MPLLAGWLLPLFTWLATVIGDLVGKHISKKATFGLAAIGTFGALTVAVWLLLSASIQALVVAVPSGPVLIGLWAMIPDSAPGVVSAVISADAALALYRWNVTNLKLASWV